MSYSKKTKKTCTLPSVPYWKLRRERALPARCTLRRLVRASAYYIEWKLWKRRLWNMISFALLAVTMFRCFLGGKSIWSYCRLSLNMSRISKTQPPSLCSICLTRVHALAALIRYFKLNTGCQDRALCKNGNADWDHQLGRWESHELN